MNYTILFLILNFQNKWDFRPKFLIKRSELRCEFNKEHAWCNNADFNCPSYTSDIVWDKDDNISEEESLGGFVWQEAIQSRVFRQRAVLT